MKILYLSHNGIADHIGQSQIAPYLLGLAEIGHDIHLISLEKAGRETLVDEYQRRFDAARIRWTRLRYHSSPPVLAQAFDTWRLRRAAMKIAQQERPDIVHCRSYLPLEAGVAVKRGTGAKLLIDFRHFYTEGGMRNSRFPLAFRALKSREPHYFRHADHIVALTDKATRILNAWYPSNAGLDRFSVIYCCADFALFDRFRVGSTAMRAARAKLGVEEDGFVLLYLGSIGPEYLVGEMFDLFKALLERRPDAKFLFLSPSGAETVREVALAKGVCEDQFTITAVPRHEVPSFLAITSLSVMFFQPGVALAGCFPTKLSEVFAFNIPVIANGGIGDLDSLLSLERNCSIAVPDFQPVTLGDAIDKVLECHEKRGGIIRDNSRAFDLPAGVAAYDGIYRALGSRPLPSLRSVE